MNHALQYPGYTIEAAIADSPTTSVFRATRVADHVPCIIKCFKPVPIPSFSLSYIRDFHAELEALTTFSGNPNIPALIGFGYSIPDDLPFLVLESIDGPDLLTHSLSAPRSVVIYHIISVCRFLDYFHRRGFVHGDLKSTHIIVPPNTTLELHTSPAKLIDFGSSHRNSDLDCHEGLQLTPAYVAPEVYDTGYTTFSSDLYAIGTIISECLLGHARAPDIRTSSNIHASDQFDRDIHSLCATLLHRSPAERKYAASEVADKLERIALDNGIQLPLGLHSTMAHLSPSLIPFADSLRRFSNLLVNATDPTCALQRPRLVELEALPAAWSDRLVHFLALLALRNGYLVWHATNTATLQYAAEVPARFQRRAWILVLNLTEPLSSCDVTSLLSLSQSSHPPSVIILVTHPAPDPCTTMLLNTLCRVDRSNAFNIAILARPSMSTYLTDTLAIQRLGVEIEESVTVASGGHPLLATIILNHLLLQGVILIAHGAAYASATPSLSPPSDDLLETVRSLFQRLNENALIVLQLLSVSTHSLTTHDIAVVLSMPFPHVRNACRHLEQLALVFHPTGSPFSYEVPGTVLRSSVSTSLSEDRRQDIHRRLANLFTRQPQDARLVVKAAHHYEQAGDVALAEKHFLEAGRALIGLLDYNSAIIPLERALAFSNYPPDTLAYVRLLLAKAYFKCRRYQDAISTLNTRTASSRIPVAVHVAQLLTLSDSELALSRLASSITHARQALRYATVHSLLEERIRALTVLGSGYCALERRVRGRRLLYRALAHSRRSHALSLALDALRTIASSHWKEGSYRRALKYETRRMRILHTTGDTRALSTAILNTGILLADLGHYAAARARYKQVRSLIAQLQLHDLAPTVLVNVGETFRAQGHSRAALKVNEIAIRLLQKTGDPHHILVSQLNRAQLLIRSGYPGSGLPLLRHLGSNETVRNIPSLQVSYLLSWGYALVAMGLNDTAGRVLNRAINKATESRLVHCMLELHLVAALNSSDSGLHYRAVDDLRSAISQYRHSAPYDVVIEAQLRLLQMRSKSMSDSGNVLPRLDRLLFTATAAQLVGIVASALVYKATLLLEHGDTSDALALYNRALLLGRETSNRDIMWRAQFGLGRTYECQMNLSVACSFFRRATMMLREQSNEIADSKLSRSFLSRSDIREVLDRYGRTLTQVGRRARYDIAALNRSEKISRRMLASLSEIGQKLNSIRDLDELLDRILDLAIENVRAERGLIFLRPSEGGEVQVASARGLGSKNLEDLTTFSRSVVRQAAGGKTIHTVDVGQDPTLASVQSILVHEIKSILCVPMRARGEVLGVIYLDTRKKAQLFTDKERTFVDTFANQAAIAIENARVFGQMKEENARLREEVRNRFPDLVGTSSAMRRLRRTISGILEADCTVLITGESGSGKGVVARTIHAHGPRREGPFVAVDCGALPESLLESELFGYRRGAFTGADRDRVGLLEEASGGTLFLDEITNTSVALQARLLRVLQEREIRRLGENAPRRVDVRVVAATNADLPALLAQGRFRHDLYYRLNVVSIGVPPLRERGEDIPLLVARFLEKHAGNRHGTRLLGPGVMDALMRYSWPGNVRELENMIERLIILSQREVISVADLPDDLRFGTPPGGSLARGESPSKSPDSSRRAGSEAPDAARALRHHAGPSKTGEQIMIEDALERFQGDKTKAARFIGWNRQKLYRRIKSFAIPADFGKAA